LGCISDIFLQTHLVTLIAARFNVGQNLYIYKQSIREAPTNWTTAVSDWYYEVGQQISMGQ
jgi:hypothetical protein